MILYEALTGRVPFEGDSAVAVALKQVSETPRRPSTVNPSVPPALDAVVMRALAKDPEARFKDADAFMKALDAAERAPDQPRPEDTAAFAAVSPEGEHAYADDEEEDWEDEEERRRRRRWILLALLVALVAGLVAFALTRPGSVDGPVGDRHPRADGDGAARGRGPRRGHQPGPQHRRPRDRAGAGPDRRREGGRGLDR